MLSTGYVNKDLIEAQLIFAVGWLILKIFAAHKPLGFGACFKHKINQESRT